MTGKILRKVITIDLNSLYAKIVYIYPAYISKHNLNHENQINTLMIPNQEGWYYLSVKSYLHY